MVSKQTIQNKKEAVTTRTKPDTTSPQGGGKGPGQGRPAPVQPGGVNPARTLPIHSCLRVLPVPGFSSTPPTRCFIVGHCVIRCMLQQCA